MEHLPPLDAGSTPAELQVEDTDLRTRLATPEAALDDSLRVRERQALLILNEMYQFVALLARLLPDRCLQRSGRWRFRTSLLARRQS